MPELPDLRDASVAELRAMAEAYAEINIVLHGQLDHCKLLLQDAARNVVTQVEQRVADRVAQIINHPSTN